MRLGSRRGGGARVCMRWDSWGVCGGGQSESEQVRIGRNKGFSDTTPVPPTGARCSSLKEISSSAQLDPNIPRLTHGNMMLYEVMIHTLREIHSGHSSTPAIMDIISQFTPLCSSGLPSQQTQCLLTGKLQHRITSDFAHSFD